MRFFGFSLQQAEEMTIYEYQYEREAYLLRRVDVEYDIHLQAYANLAVQKRVKQGQDIVSAFPTFESFFDINARVEQIVNPKKKEEEPKKVKKVKNLMLEANSL